jgi:predicted ATPase
MAGPSSISERLGSTAFADVGEEWSEPRPISEVLDALGMGGVQRLKTPRFQAMVRALQDLGVEMGVPNAGVLTADVGSPGLRALVCLRRESTRSSLSSLSSVSISNFKSFESATLPLSELTLLIGANASGKSNALEALQLLSWMASGRRLGNLGVAVRDAELAMRGAVDELTWNHEVPSFGLACVLDAEESHPELRLSLQIGVERDGLRVLGEELIAPQIANLPLYRVTQPARAHGREMSVEYNNFTRGGHKPQIACVDEQPVFTQLTTPARFGEAHHRSQEVIPAAAHRLQAALEDILFLDPNPRAMRGYSFAGEKRLRGDGGNLSGILFDLGMAGGSKDELLAFIRALPEQDILDIEFLEGPRGEVMVRLNESFGGTPTWREAALLSDGTLRVLAIAAAVLSVPKGSMVVIEEIDNGVHPSRAAHLLERIRAVSTRRKLRILLTTHNPALLDALPPEALPNVVACYRDPVSGSSRLIRLDDLESYPDLIARGPLGQLVTQGVLDRYLKHQESADERVERNLRWLADAKRRASA